MYTNILAYVNTFFWLPEWYNLWHKQSAADKIFDACFWTYFTYFKYFLRVSVEGWFTYVRNYIVIEINGIFAWQVIAIATWFLKSNKSIANFVSSITLLETKKLIIYHPWLWKECDIWPLSIIPNPIIRSEQEENFLNPHLKLCAGYVHSGKHRTIVVDKMR